MYYILQVIWVMTFFSYCQRKYSGLMLHRKKRVYFTKTCKFLNIFVNYFIFNDFYLLAVYWSFFFKIYLNKETIFKHSVFHSIWVSTCLTCSLYSRLHLPMGMTMYDIFKLLYIYKESRTFFFQRRLAGGYLAGDFFLKCFCKMFFFSFSLTPKCN